MSEYKFIKTLNGKKAPKGFHYMPNGKLMNDAHHVAQFGYIEKTINKRTIKIIEGTVQIIEALCSCGEYMDSMEEFQGYPNLIRTEPSLKK